MLRSLSATRFPVWARPRLTWLPRLPRLPRRATAIVSVALVLALASHLAAEFGRQGAGVADGPADGQTSAVIGLPGQPAVDAALESRQRIDGAIAVWTGNLERDSADFIAAIHLSEIYLTRASTTGQTADYDRALDAVGRALAIDASLVPARLLNAQVLFAIHDFAGAQATAEALLVDQPGLPQAVATLGDARLEQGDYAGAAEAYDRLSVAVGGAPVVARQARLASLTGSLATARELAAEAARLATADADTDPGTDPVSRAWYHVLGGALAFQAGDVSAAQSLYQAALVEWPTSAPARVGAARALAALGDSEGAIQLYEQAAALYPQPETLAALGDLYALTGRADEAATRHEQVRALAAIDDEAGLFNRGVILFLANHAERPAEAVALAAADLETRKDVYGWDAYAWALYANGQYEEADAAIIHARAQGTEDAVLDYHAGMIAAALGRDADAQRLLEAALARNPTFDQLQAPAARATLDSLATGQ
jgi:tetratricopeptide (TPR) repeat protein